LPKGCRLPYEKGQKREAEDIKNVINSMLAGSAALTWAGTEIALVFSAMP